MKYKPTFEVYELVFKHYVYDQNNLEKLPLEEPICVRQMIDHKFSFNNKSFVINDMIDRLKSFILEKIKND